MNWHVDRTIRIGAARVAAIVENRITVHAVGPAFVGSAQRNPLLFVHIRDEQVSGVDSKGRRYKREEIEMRYPGAIDQIRAD